MRTLTLLGEYVGAQRCYLVQYSNDGALFSFANEWVAEGIQPHIQNLQNYSAATAPWWTAVLRHTEIIHIPNVEQMPPEADMEKKILQERGIQSVAVVPLISEHILIGFLGFDKAPEKTSHSSDKINLLKSIAEILTNAIYRAQLQLELQEHIRQIEKSLEEKSVLLKEIHHRVKNNLQVISSLLSLQSAQIKDPQARQLFNDSQNRVRSMALIHEKLYQSNDLAHIDFKDYVQNLSNFLMRSFAAEMRGVRSRLDIENIFLKIDQAIPCGLILNELVSNSLKHAFPEGRNGEVYIQFRLDENRQYHLTVGDNGAGFPADIDFQNTTSLGLQLVSSLTGQIDGNIELIKTPGTEFRITFYETNLEAVH
jgi:two-component sensor histidine kinase